MQRRRSQSPLFLILFFALILFTLSLLFLLPTQSVDIPTQKADLLSPTQTITLHAGTISFSTSSATLWTRESYERYENQTSKLGQLALAIFPSKQKTINPFNEEKVKAWIESVSPQLTQPDESPNVVFAKDGKTFVLFPGKRGQKMNTQETVKTTLSLDFSSTHSAQISLEPTGKELTPDTLITSQIDSSPGGIVGLERLGFYVSIWIRDYVLKGSL